ncbi:MAG TPA: hypothetical protein VFG03_01330 [Telluria sp.]|nr:hypothetical protein [Telluria sp.]
MLTRVCITVDTEFSIAGAFDDPRRAPVAEPIVWCNAGGKSQGLGFMLDCFERFHTTATFFVEALHRAYFSADPMRPIARRIAARGHEVQLHAHPCWTVFDDPDWRRRVRAHPDQDDFFGRAEDDSVALIRRGLAVFDDWGLPQPEVFRSGNLQHDDVLYRALARAQVPYSSNVGLSLFDSGDPRYALYAGCHTRHGVVEFPVLTYRDWHLAGHSHLKSLTIAGASFLETRSLLERAHQAHMPLVVILTHPFEYVQSCHLDFGHARRHALNQQRLRDLCGFLDANRSRFLGTGLAEAAGQPSSVRAPHNPVLDGKLWHSVCRMAAQAAYDRFGHWELARDARRAQRGRP